MTRPEFPPREAYKAWLESKAPDAYVGTARSSFSCPLSCFAQDELRINVNVVPLSYSQGYWRDATGKNYPLPDWANVQGLAIDHRYTSLRVTAAEALALLEQYK